MSCSSVSATPRALAIAWCTVTNTSVPLRPDLTLTSAMRELRVISSPTRSGWMNCSRPPAHMRRGSGTGGSKPPLRAWPSGPISLARASGVKYNQCASGGSGSPGRGAGSSRSSVAESAASGAAVTQSMRCSARPIHSCHGLVFIALSAADVRMSMAQGWTILRPAGNPPLRSRRWA